MQSLFLFLKEMCKLNLAHLKEMYISKNAVLLTSLALLGGTGSQTNTQNNINLLKQIVWETHQNRMKISVDQAVRAKCSMCLKRHANLEFDRTQMIFSCN